MSTTSRNPQDDQSRQSGKFGSDQAELGQEITISVDPKLLGSDPSLTMKEYTYHADDPNAIPQQITMTTQQQVDPGQQVWKLERADQQQGQARSSSSTTRADA